MSPYIIGIAGPSGAGKTTVGKFLSERYPEITHIRQDDFLKNPATFPKLGKWQNWEDPQNIQFDILATALRDLKAGKTTTTPQGWEIKPSPIILVEGSMLFTNDQVAQLLDCKIVITLPENLQLKRRLKRQPDVPEHEEYFREVVTPSFKKHIEPSLKMGEIHLSGNEPVGRIAERILAFVPETHLKQK